MSEYLQYILDSFIYNIVDAITFGIGLGIFIKVIALITPLKSLEKIKENSFALAITWITILVLFATYAILGYFFPEV